MRVKIHKVLRDRLKPKKKAVTAKQTAQKERLEKYSTLEFFKMTSNLAKLTVLSFWRKHRILSRLIALMMVFIILFGLFYDSFDRKQQVDVYDITGRVSALLDDPVSLYTEMLVTDADTGTIVFNEGYTPGGDVAGSSYAPKIIAEFKPAPDASVTVSDPVNEVGITLKPKFSVKSPIVNENRVLYPINGLPATKVYTLKGSGVKEDIIFREAPTQDEIVFQYEIILPEGLETRLESDGSIGVYGVKSLLLGDVTASTEKDAELLKDARENSARTQFLFSIPAPVVLESRSQRSTANARFELDGNILTLRATGLKTAKYPLSVDPTIYVESARELMRGNNETNIDFDVSNELIQKSQTTGARIDNWQSNLDLSEDVWGHSTAAAGGFVYRAGGRTGDGTIATPPVLGGNVESLQSSNSSSFTMGMPGTRPSGDLYIAVMCHDGTGTVTPPAGGGWTEYADVREYAAYWKIGEDKGGGDEGANYTWTGSSEKWGGVVMRVTNFNTSTPVSPTPTTDSGNSSTPTFPAITPANNDTLIIRALGADNDEIDDAGWAPAGHTAISQGGPTGTQDCAYAAASMDSSPASGVSTGTTNMQSGYINDTYGSSTIAINPKPGSGSSPTVVDTVEWAQFNPSSFAIESPNPGTGACSDWCTNSVYDLPEPRQNHSMVSYNGYLYVIGGEDSSGTRESTVYISKLGANGEPQLWHPTDSNINNWVYWFEDTGLSGGLARSYLSAVAYNNRMYIVGGQTNGAPGGITTVERADILPNGKLSNWTTTGMNALPAGAGRHMGDVVVYNDTLYAMGGFEGAETSTANLRNSSYYSKLNNDGTMNTWQTAENFPTPRANFGGSFSYIWGAYIYAGGGCSAVNGSGYCTTFANDMQLASINADGSLGTWRSIGSLDNTRIGYTFVGWQGGLYRLGGCLSVSLSSGECTNALNDVDYGVINPAGEVSTVKISDEIGEGTCVGGAPSDCDLPDLGDGAGQGGGMLSSTVILNGYLYVIGGCTNFGCSTSSGNVSYTAISSSGDLQKPDTCPGTYSGAWCVDSTNQVNGTNGVAAAGITVFNNRIYLVGGIDESATGVQAVTHNGVNDDGSLDGAWESDTFGSIGVSGEKSYTYAYARANPASAGTNPGNLYIIGGCSAFSNSAGCSNSYNTEVYKCNISTSGSVSGCTTSGQLQIDAELATETNQGLGLHSGTVYANYIYLIGGYSDNIGDRATVFYAKFDDNNNIVDAESGTANPASDDDDWIESPNQLSIGRRRGFAFGYNGHIYAVGGFNAGGAGIIPFIEWAKEDVSSGSIDNFVTSSVTINQRWGLSMAVSNSYAYVVGGCDVGDSPSGCSSFEPSIQTFQLYNNDSGTPAGYAPAANQFATDRYAASTVIHNGYIYVAGGCTDSLGNCTETSDSVQYAALDAEGDIGAWSAAAALPEGRGWGKLREAGNSLYWVAGQSDSVCDPTGDALYERYNGIAGTAVSDLYADPDWPDSPDVTSVISGSTLVSPSGVADDYGARVSALLCAPQDGNYTFWIASDDSSELNLSTDATPGSKTTIATVSGWTNVNEWTKYGSQQSTTVTLEAGKYYYVEGVVKEGSGGDHVEIGWQLPDSTLERPIPDTRYSMPSEASAVLPAVESDVFYATPNASTGNISSWATATNSLPTARADFGAVSWNDRLYVVGGINTSGAVTGTVYISPDLSSGGNITSAWSSEADVPDVARSGNTVVAYANNLYSFGGYDGSNYLLDSQFSQISSDGSLDEWTFTTPLPNTTRQAEGFAANGYMYVVGGRSADNVCDSNTYVAPISANTTIATGNNPTGVGEWNETNVRYSGDRYGNAVAYNKGRLYLMGGGCLEQSSTVFSSQGADTYVVPAGVTSIVVKMWGAGGGGGAGGSNSNGGDGGGSGYSQSTLAVTPGESLNIYVGGGGDGGTYAGSNSGGGGGGGGHSEVNRSGTNLLIAAGGAGGGGGDNSSSTPGGAGGAGGGATGVDGGDSSNANGGNAGSTGSGGSGGTGGSNNGSGGGAETAGDGGNGGSGTGSANNGGAADDGDGGSGDTGGYGGGGGGGGGRYGGGGGSSSAAGDAGGGGGGGGSNYLTGSSQTNGQGSGQTPGNSSDPDRSGAGNGASGGGTISGGGTGSDGRIVISTGGGPTMTLTGANRAIRTTLLSQPQLAKYSRLIDTDSDVFPNSWLINGLDNSIGARWQVRYRSMHDIDTDVAPNEDCGTTSAMPQMTTWGADTFFGDTILGDVNPYSALNSTSGDINCARYFYFFIEIDAEQTFGYPEDVERGPTIADLSLFFTSDPSKRLRHGKTFTGGEQQPLDTPCRQDEDPDCPLPPN